MDAYRYRVFISYAHTDEGFVGQLAEVLKENELQPVWDKDLAAGDVFSEKLKTFIMHADVFLPVISEKSHARGWIHQETGFAMAHRIPILPVYKNFAPPDLGMISQFQAVQCGDDPHAAKAKLSAASVSRLVRDAEQTARPLYECAVFPNDRARMLAEYATRVQSMPQSGHVRQRGGLTSFHIPTETTDDPIWQDRYGTVVRSDEHKELLREERRALSEHARAEGCTLIIDVGGRFGPDVREARVRPLLQFLDDMPEGTVRVVFTRTESQESATMVGDWFYAQSVRATIEKGYHNTVFTRHAPTIRRLMREFDSRVQQLGRLPVNERAATRAGAKDFLRDFIDRGSDVIPAR